MKIVLLSAASSIHTVRWANGLSTAGHDVHVISQHEMDNPFLPSVSVYCFPYRGMLGYFLMVPSVRKLLVEIKPDILNAHYASGYGTTARLVNYHPYLLSVWGSDIYSFPKKTILHRWLVKKNIYAADKIASTSLCMADETRTLVPKINDIEITPFGVEPEVYKCLPKANTEIGKIVIGTVKTLSKTYGIDLLIKAYAMLLQSLMKNNSMAIPELELRLVGGGEELEELNNLANDLGVGNSVKFIGQVPHALVPLELAKLDIYVALSRAESFGVAVIEASAAGLPVIVSDVGGLPEVVVNGKTGLVVSSGDLCAAKEALERLVLDANLRHEMGAAGMRYIKENYSWDVCVDKMLGVYNDTLFKYKNKK